MRVSMGSKTSQSAWRDLTLPEVFGSSRSCSTTSHADAARKMSLGAYRHLGPRAVSRNCVYRPCAMGAGQQVAGRLTSASAAARSRVPVPSRTLRVSAYFRVGDCPEPTNVGAVRGMELDINTDWVNFATYAPSAAAAPATPANGSLLLSGMTGTTARYFASWWPRDFFTMSARSSGG